MLKVEFTNYRGRSKSTGLICHMDYKQIDAINRERADRIIDLEKLKGSTWEEVHIYEVLK